MSGRTFATAVAVLLIVSTLVVLVPSPLHGAPNALQVGAPRTDAAAPTAMLVYGTYNGLDAPTSVFYPGQSIGGTLYFSVTDFFDKQVNITITDPNATRDGVPSPAFHYEATLNTTTSTFNSYAAGVSYKFPAALPYGGPWDLNVSAPAAGTVHQNLSVRVYTLTVSSSAGNSATIPGEPLTVFWTLSAVSNGETLYTRATNVTITGHYVGNGTVRAFFPKNVALTPASAGHGQWSGSVPLNTEPNTLIHLEVYADTNLSGQIAENESANLTVQVGVLTIHGTGLTPAPPTCDLVNDVYFPNGTLVAGCILAGASYRAAFTPIAGLTVNITFWNGTAHVGPSYNLSTNASGEAAFSFLASTPPFIEETQSPRFDAVNFTVSVPGASALYTIYTWKLWSNVSWSVLGGSTASGAVQVTLDRANYYVGATATATWAIASSNLSRTGPIAAVGWAVTGPSAITYAEGTLNGTVPNGTFTFLVTPPMALQTIDVWVYAANATAGYGAYAIASVVLPSLLLTPSSTYYTAGSTTSVTAVLNGGGTLGPIQYEVFGNWASGQALLASGSVVAGGAIPVPVSAITPPPSVYVDAWVAATDGQVVATASLTLYLALGFSVLLGVTTLSNYADGSYQPGQTVTLSYEVVSVGGAALPQVLTFTLFAIGYPSMDQFPNVGPSGTIAFTIPSNAVQGTLFVELEAGSSRIACLPAGDCVAITSLLINPHPSLLGWEIGAGSGVTLGWFVLLVLVVVVAIVLLLLQRRRGRRPTSAPAMAPAAEWQETPPESGSGPSGGSPSSPPPPGA